jgi:hypothetical protein
MLPTEQLLDELGGDGMTIEEAGEDPLAEQSHQERGIPFRRREEAAVRGEAAVGGEQVVMRVPLQEVSGGGHRNDEAGAEVASDRTTRSNSSRCCSTSRNSGDSRGRLGL